MTQPAVTLQELKALLGKEWVFTAPEEVGRASIREFALAIGDLNPLYLDEAAAGRSKYGSIIAPPTFVCETTQYYRGAIDSVGYFTDRVVLPGTALRAGNEYRFLRPLRPEDVVTARWKVADLAEREGRTGRLAFLIVEITYSNQHNEVLALNRETYFYQLPKG